MSGHRLDLGALEQGVGRLDPIVGLPASVIAAVSWARGGSAHVVFLVVGIIMGLNWMEAPATIDVWRRGQLGSDPLSVWGNALVIVCCALGGLGLASIVLFVGANFFDPPDPVQTPIGHGLFAGHRGLLHAATDFWVLSGVFAAAMALIGLMLLISVKRADPSSEPAPAGTPTTGKIAASRTVSPAVIVPCPWCEADNELAAAPPAGARLRCGGCREEFPYRAG